MVKQIQSEEREWGDVYRKKIGGSTVYFTGFDDTNAQIRAELFEKLHERCGITEILGDGKIPTAVACEGKVAIAAYLYSAQLQSVEEISEQLSVSSSTIEQYLIDFRNGRR